jgi:hypothetical protein
MASIQRQLNLYGFRCANRIDEKGVFHHPQFIRGQYDLVRNIRRKRTWPTKRPPKEQNNMNINSNNNGATSFVGSVAPQASSMPPPYYVLPAPASSMGNHNPASTYGSASFSLVKPETTTMYKSFFTSNSPRHHVLPEGVTPLSQLLSSDELLIDLFDGPTNMDNMADCCSGMGNMVYKTATIDAADYMDQGLLNLFDNDQLIRVD